MSAISSSTSSRCSGGEEILGTEPYADLDRETVSAILAEADHLATTKLAESFADGDALPVFDPKTHAVTVPEALKKSFRALMDSGAWQLELPSRARRSADATIGAVGDPRAEHRRQSGGAALLGRPQVRVHAVGRTAMSVIDASPRS